jgi:hypothetical protein
VAERQLSPPVESAHSPFPSRVSRWLEALGDSALAAFTKSPFQTAFAGCIYLVYALWSTWPMAVNPTSSIYGPGGDVTGAMATWRELAQNAFPFFPGTIESLQAPEGLRVDNAFYTATWPSTAFMYVATALFGAVPAMNLLVVTGYVGTGIAMFLLLRRFTGEPWVAAIFGWAFAFRADAIFNGTGAPDFTHGWILALMVWRLFELRDEPTLRNGLWAGLASVIAISWNPYWLLMGTVAFGALAVGILISRIRTDVGAQTRALAAACGVLVGFFGLYAFVTLTGDFPGTRAHPIADLYLYSARPFEYLVPRPDNILFQGTDFGLRGGLVREGKLYFYVGLVVAAFAALAFLRALTWLPSSRERENVLIVAWLGFVALVWSGPPTAELGPVTLRFPSDLVSDLTTTWRIYGRFGIVVSFAVCLLAGYGLAAVVRGRRQGTRTLVLVLAAVVVFLDLKEPRLPVTRIAKPGIYAALKDRSSGYVAEYPLVPAGYAVYEQIFNQDYHGRRLLNGYPAGSSAEARALSLARLDDLKTPIRLRSLGVRYVVLNRARQHGPEVPTPGRPAHALRLLATEGSYELYEVAPSRRR